MTRADKKKPAVGQKRKKKIFFLVLFVLLHLSSCHFFTPLELRAVKLSQILCHLSANVKFTAVATT
jgi:hypothetical protein